MKISIKKDFGIPEKPDAWNFCVTDDGQVSQEVGKIVFQGGIFEWWVTFYKPMGIFPAKGECFSLLEAKKNVRGIIKKCYTQWQEKSPPEQDQVVLFHYLREIKQCVEGLNLTGERQERMAYYMESLESWMQFDECVANELSLNCVMDPIDFDELLDAIIGLAYFSYSTSYQGFLASTIEDIRSCVKIAGERVVKEIARQENS